MSEREGTPELPDTTRKLVTIRQVRDVVPIPNADNIELAKIDGWQCVTKKGDFQPGDLGVYFEVDSLLPIEERYEFLRPSSYKRLEDGSKGFRLKTVKLRKTLSQGLLLPLSMFPELFNIKEKHCSECGTITGTSLYTFQVGIDVTDLLHVTKWEQPVPASLRGLRKGRFPAFIQMTDQERIQNLLEYFTQYKDTPFEESEKLNGTSCTIYCNEGEIGVCSHHLDLKETATNDYWKMARQCNLEDTLLHLHQNIAIQAELVGPGINKNPLHLPAQKLFVFNIWSTNEHRYLTPSERMAILRDLHLDHVPIVASKIRVFKEYDTIEKLLTHAHDKSLVNPAVDREGIVFKSTDLINGQIVSFKVVDNEYLLKEQE